MSARAIQGAADTTIDGRGFMAMPGLVNVHSHPCSEAGNKGLTDEFGSRQALPKLALRVPDGCSGPTPRASRTSTACRGRELLMSGVTTLVDLSIAERRLDRPGRRVRARGSSWRRCCATGPGSPRTATRSTTPRRGGRREGHGGGDGRSSTRRLKHPSGRLGGLVCPAQIDTCTRGLLPRCASRQRRARACRSRSTPPSRSVEFQEMVRRTGLTPMHGSTSIGVPGPARLASATASSSTTIRRCAGRTATTSRAWREIGRIGRPLPDRVRAPRRDDDATRPLHEGRHQRRHRHRHLSRTTWSMRCGTPAPARITAETPSRWHQRRCLRCATLGGARLLRPPDIGRLALGAKADFCWST